MSQRARTWGLVLWAALVIVIIVANMVRPGPGMEDIWPWAGGLLAFPIAAVIVLVRVPRNTIGRLLGVVATAAGVDFALSWVAVSLAGSPQAGYAEAATAPASVTIFIAILGLLHLFPTGRPVARWHRWVLLALVAWGGAFAVLGLFAPGPAGFSGAANPLAIGPAWIGSLFDAGFAGVPLFGLLGIVVLVVRRRRAGPVERAQLKWFFAGSALLTLVLALLTNSGQLANVVAETLSQLLAMFAFWCLPAAIVVAIVRYHLYDIDRLVSRTATYLVVAGVLTAVYALCIVSLQVMVPAGSSQVAVAASTLAVAGLFAPVRSRVQQRLDRRFNRARYEAGAITRDFARRLQQQIDLETIQADLLRAVEGTVQPGAIQMWLTRRETMSGYVAGTQPAGTVAE